MRITRDIHISCYSHVEKIQLMKDIMKGVIKFEVRNTPQTNKRSCMKNMF